MLLSHDSDMPHTPMITPPLHQNARVQTKNSEGNWVPAIPEPWVVLFGYRCSECHSYFFTRAGYEGHYALRHILKP